jgi:DNA-binding CsgD family transcriptional regulator
VWAEGEGPTADPSRQAKVDETPLIPSDAGFLLLDSSLRPIYANQDAVRILCYPQVPKPSKAAMQAIKKRVDSLLRGHLPSLGSPSLVEFVSGKRRYLLRAFYLDSHTSRPLQPAYALLMERGHHVLLELAHISNQYGLTSREIETMRLLLGGLTSKEIASRMNISPNTVKVFLRLIMLKMGVTTRAGIIGKFVSS